LIGLEVKNESGSVVYTATPSATDTEVTIPGGRLPPHHDYRCALQFKRIVRFNSSFETPALAAYCSVTEFSLSTFPSIVLQIVESLPQGEFQFRFNVVPGQRYRIQASADLRTWETMLEFDAAVETEFYAEPISSGPARRLFRIERVRPSGGF
jgi:hypothetical protein